MDLAWNLRSSHASLSQLFYVRIHVTRQPCGHILTLQLRHFLGDVTSPFSCPVISDIKKAVDVLIAVVVTGTVQWQIFFKLKVTQRR